MIDRFGGLWTPPDNVFDASALAFVVDTVQSEIFGVPLYDSLHKKAAVYCRNIIQNHIFCDGNKRTGMQTALAFLEINGSPPSPGLLNQDIVNMALRVATKSSSIDEITSWFEANAQPLRMAN